MTDFEVVCEDIWNVFFSQKYQFSDDSIPAFYHLRSIDSNLHLISTAIILYKQKLMSISRMNDCVQVFTKVCKEFDSSGISVSSEEQIQFLIKQLRFVNLVINKQFIYDWVFRCYKYLVGTKQHAKHLKQTNAKVSAK